MLESEDKEIVSFRDAVNGIFPHNALAGTGTVGLPRPGCWKMLRELFYCLELCYTF